MNRFCLVIGGMWLMNVSLVATAQNSAESAQNHIDRCIAYYVHGDLARATAELRQGVELDSKNAQLYFMLGNALYRAGDMRGAVHSYSQSLQLRPNQLEAHMSLGFAYYEQSEFREAIAQWQSAVQLNPKEPFARAGLALGLYTIGQVGGATNEYAMASLLDERYADPECLRLDIRWKAEAVHVLKRLRQLLREEETGIQ
jgi:Flp pilus assembly protein TadD